jgi:hypothetical protein
MSKMKFHPVRIEDASNLRHEFKLETTDESYFRSILIARFIGDYRGGSSGRPDAVYMTGMLRMAVELWGPAGLVLDLSGVRYDWGDEMYWLLPPDVGGKKAAVVVGPKCARAIATLLWGVNTTKEATEAEFIFDNVVAAWEAVRHRD